MANNKFNNKLVKIDGHIFPSQGEAARYLQLKDMESKHLIDGLQIQVGYELIPACKRKRVKGTNRSVKYIADFVYVLDGNITVEDFKGKETDVFRIKEKLMLWIFGIEILKSNSKDIPAKYKAEVRKRKYKV